MNIHRYGAYILLLLSRCAQYGNVARHITLQIWNNETHYTNIQKVGVSYFIMQLLLYFLLIFYYLTILYFCFRPSALKQCFHWWHWIG